MAAGRPQPAAELYDVHKRFDLQAERLFGPGRSVHAVSGVSLVLKGGETLGIEGSPDAA